MLTRTIPSTGERVPALGMGTWQTFDVGGGGAERTPLAGVLRRFVELGGSLVDASPMYGRAEQVLGDLATETGTHERLFLATKVWTRGQAEGVAQMERSFRLLRTDRIDLIQVHNLLDAETHLETLVEWKRQGRVRYIGISHYKASAYDDIEQLLAAYPIDFAQFNYSIGARAAERRLLPFCADRGVAVLVNRPFEEGALFRAVRGRTLPDEAAELGCRGWADFFLRYILSHAAVTCVIPATGDVEHLEENMAAGAGALPDEAGRRRLAELFEGLR